MHYCEEFRERITEHIIDREDLMGNEEFQEELLICPGCADFYAESREMMEALSAVDLTISERHWEAIGQRLRLQLVNTVASAGETQAPEREVLAGAAQTRERAALVNHRRGAGPLRSASAITRSLRFTSPLQLLAASAMLLISVGLYRLATPLVNMEGLQTPVPRAVYADHSVALDPVTVDFLEESELLLRNMMKLTPNDTDDLADAMRAANGQLADIEQRKNAAADVPPVVDVIDTYETILRDIRNLDGGNAAEDIADIQSRIRKNGLIANIKAFQPSVTPASFDVR